MTIASLIVNVAANTVQLQQDVKKVQSSLDGILGVAGRVGSVLGVAFSLGSVVAFGREIINDADAISRMSDQTGIGIEALQRLRGIADDSGNSIEQLTSAISMMQNRLAHGDKNAVSAVDALGLSMDEFIAMKPDEQFMAVARGVREMEDPLKRAKVGADLFGKSFAQIMPSLRADVDAIASSTKVMSEKSIQNWDKLGDAITRWARNAKAEIGNAVFGLHDTARQAQIDAMIQIEDGLRLPDLPGGPKSMTGAPLNVPGLPTPDVIMQTERELKKAVDRVQESERASRAAASSARDLTSSFEAMGPSMDQWIADLNEDAWQGPTLAMMDLGRELHKLENVRPGITADDMREIGQATKEAALVWVQDYGPSMEQAGFQAQTFKSTMQGVLGDLNNVFVAAFSGGGGIGGAIKSLATNMTEGLLGMIPGIGPFLSQFSGAIVAGLSKLGGKIKGFFTNLFGGPNADELAGRQIVDGFEKNVASMLSEKQRIETGNDSWKQTVVGLRDRYIELGLTEAEALHDAERLWASSQNGADAAQRVVDELTRKMEGLASAATSAGAAMGGLGGLRDPMQDLGVVPMARGGYGRVTRPTLFLAGEAGAEDVAFSGAGRSFGRGSSDTVIDNSIYLDGELLYRAVDRRQSRDARSRRLMRAA